MFSHRKNATLYFVGFDTEKPCTSILAHAVISDHGKVKFTCLAFENHISSCKKYMSKSETLSSQGLH